MGTLSVRENLHFSAALRLPSNMTHKQRKRRVDMVISELGLTKCSDTKVHFPACTCMYMFWLQVTIFMLIKIGNEFIRGVSGGERKRTNIGMELIIEPQVLFLDEPTTGLDAHTAISVVQLLKRWVHSEMAFIGFVYFAHYCTCSLSIKGNNVVIMSIHQPRYSIFKLLDTLTLLSDGNMVYHGAAAQALSYFSEAG